jgi:aminoglycoside 3-N-acetyltransferase
MESYTESELTSALAESGIVEGDLVYLSTRLFGLGHMSDCANRNDFLAKSLKSIRAVIGARGTIVAPSFTQQVGDFAMDYVHETTPCRTGLFSEYIRSQETSVRSVHPVFSVVANGPLANDICHEVSPVAFGADSAFDRIVQFGGKATCVGFQRQTGHIVSLMHHVETVFAVPYYYTKLVAADVYMSGQKMTQDYFINVKYLEFDVRFDFLHYISALEKSDLLGHASLGGGDVYTCGGREQFDLGVRLLKHDVYAFLAEPPKFVQGRVPCDGTPKNKADFDEVKNWIGHDLSLR